MEIIDSHTPPPTTDRVHLLSLPTCAGGVPSARVLRSLLFLRGLYIVFSFRILHKMFHIDPDGEGCRGMVDPLVRVYRSSPRRSRERRNGSTTHLDSCAPARVVERPPGGPRVAILQHHSPAPSEWAPPTALAADGSSPQIAGDLPPGALSAWAAPDLTVSPSAAVLFGRGTR